MLPLILSDNNNKLLYVPNIIVKTETLFEMLSGD